MKHKGIQKSMSQHNLGCCMRSWIGQVRLSLLQETQTDWSWSHGWEKRQCLKPGWWCLPGFDLPRWTTSTGLWKLPMPLIKDNWPGTMRCGLRIAVLVALFLEWASLVGTWNFYNICMDHHGSIITAFEQNIQQNIQQMPNKGHIWGLE